jgi:hypothetical protein
MFIIIEIASTIINISVVVIIIIIIIIRVITIINNNIIISVIIIIIIIIVSVITTINNNIIIISFIIVITITHLTDVGETSFFIYSSNLHTWNSGSRSSISMSTIISNSRSICVCVKLEYY